MKKPVTTTRFLNQVCQGAEEKAVAEEAPLTVHLNGKEMATLLSSPVLWDELAVGFCLSEGLLKPLKKDLKMQLDYDRGMAWVESPHVDKVAERTWQKRFITSGCGGSTSFYSLVGSRQLLSPLDDGPVVAAGALTSLMRAMQQKSVIYADTHGVHGAALCSCGELEVFREDVGRHNALDKIRGYCFLNDLSSDGKILLSTGRISSEMLLKASRLNTPILVSRSTPTTLAVEQAAMLNITLVGMVKGRGFNVYTVPERVS